jgi:transcriptional regulator with XRE-family HTH domain
MSTRPAPTPEGELIKDALKRTRLSARRAAERAGISEGRWRQIVNGYQTVTRGQHVPVTGPAETVARMAHVVGVTPEQLEGVQRADAAAELRLLLRTMPAETDGAAPAAAVFTDPAEVAMWGMSTMSEAERADHIATMRVRRVTAELRAERDRLAAEVIALRQQLGERQAG